MILGIVVWLFKTPPLPDLSAVLDCPEARSYYDICEAFLMPASNLRP